jgi:hypothetical protein
MSAREEMCGALQMTFLITMALALCVVSDTMVGVVRSFSSFSAALDEVSDARVFAGIHFRSACEAGRAAGASVANYVSGNSLQPIHGNHTGQIQH